MSNSYTNYLGSKGCKTKASQDPPTANETQDL